MCHFGPPILKKIWRSVSMTLYPLLSTGINNQEDQKSMTEKSVDRDVKQQHKTLHRPIWVIKGHYNKTLNNRPCYLMSLFTSPSWTRKSYIFLVLLTSILMSDLAWASFRQPTLMHSDTSVLLNSTYASGTSRIWAQSCKRQKWEIKTNNVHYPLYTIFLQTEDSDEMPPNETFHQSLHLLLR